MDRRTFLRGLGAALGVAAAKPSIAAVPKFIADPTDFTIECWADVGGWHHIAVERIAGKIVKFVDGARTEEPIPEITVETPLAALRITRGIARYREPFPLFYSDREPYPGAWGLGDIKCKWDQGR